MSNQQGKQRIMFFPTIKQLIAMQAQQKLRDDTHIALVTFITNLFNDLKSVEEVNTTATEIMATVQKHIMSDLSQQERDVLPFQDDNELFEFIKAIGVSNLPENVQDELRAVIEERFRKQ